MKILRGRFRLSIRLNYTIVPIDVVDRLAALQKLGYTVGKPPTLPAGSAGTLEAAPIGRIATLRDSTVDIDLNRGILGVDSSTAEEMLTGFRHLLQVLQKDLNIDTNAHTSFVEFITDLNIEGDSQALQALRTVQTSLTSVTAKAFGEDTSVFGLRFGSADHEPSGPSWLDLRIEPLLRNLQVYVVSLVYRNPDVKKVISV